jgi:tetratricopeptide (TPR) repeat protein
VNIQDATLLENDIDQALAVGDFDRAEVLVTHYRAVAQTELVNGGAARSPRFRALYLAAQVALAAGRLAEAAQRLGALMPLPRGLPAALACRIWLLSAEALARLRRHHEARSHLARARDCGFDVQSDTRLLLRELRVRLWLGDLHDLKTSLEACGRALKAKGDVCNHVLLLCEEGRAHDASGDMTRAKAVWTEAERLSRRLDRDPVRADVLIQLGRLEHLRGNLQAALDHYEAALNSGAPPPQIIEARLRRVLVLLDLNQWGQARAEYARTLGATGSEQLPEELQPLAGMLRALLLDAPGGDADAELLGYQAAARGELATARALYQRALQESEGPERRARLGLALGMLALACGDRAEARRWLHEAEEIAQRLNLREVLWRARLARGQMAAELDNDDQLARRLLEEAVLLSEEQAATLRHRTDAAAHHLHRADVLRLLARAACRRGDAAAVFHYQELERGRLLLELWRAAPRAAGRATLGESPALLDLEQRLHACEHEIEAIHGPAPDALQRCRQALLLERDQLFDDHLRDRSRRGDAALPALPELEELQHALPQGTVYVAPTLVENELYLLVVRPGSAAVLTSPVSASRLGEQVGALRKCLAAQLDRYHRGLPLGRPARQELNGCLDDLGQGSLGQALARALDDGAGNGERVLWVPDGALHGVPVHALRRNRRYLIEGHEFVFAFGGALFVHQARAANRKRRWGPGVVLTESEAVLPAAVREGQGVAASFWRRRLLHGAAASCAALRRYLPTAGVLHFACHATFDVEHPLAACINLPSGETWHALDWLDEPLAGLQLATLSACRSAEVSPLVGREVFGLVTGLLTAGTRAVVAGLWPVADREAVEFMWRFYRHRLTEALPTALARAQRDAAAEGNGSPLFWATFALFGDPRALPAPGRWGRLLARWRQRRHARQFPLSADKVIEGE